MDHFFIIKTFSTLILNKIAPQIKISQNQKQYELNPKLQQITIEPFTKTYYPKKKIFTSGCAYRMEQDGLTK